MGLYIQFTQPSSFSEKRRERCLHAVYKIYRQILLSIYDMKPYTSNVTIHLFSIFLFASSFFLWKSGNDTRRRKYHTKKSLYTKRRRNLIHRQIGLFTLDFTKKLCDITLELEDLFCSEDLLLIIIIFMYIIFVGALRKMYISFFILIVLCNIAS